MTTSTYPDSRTAHQNRWISRRHEDEASRQVAIDSRKGETKTQKRRQERAMNRHIIALARYEKMAEMTPENMIEEVHWIEFKIRQTKRLMKEASARLAFAT